MFSFVIFPLLYVIDWSQLQLRLWVFLANAKCYCLFFIIIVTRNDGVFLLPPLVSFLSVKFAPNFNYSLRYLGPGTFCSTSVWYALFSTENIKLQLFCILNYM
ncbi:hypothetical protein VNO77_13685 [Canavalia gladiata]|uniref:Uncharacterized protein n=1 Tax=Canavalia gladiata TaxID=3824 RepID=A0AAN9LY17_CANGL